MTKRRNAQTLLELIVIVVIVAAAILAVVAVSNVPRGSAVTKTMVCRNNIATMNTQIELYHSTNNSWPSTLRDVTNSLNYFPEGAPTCPAGGKYSMSRDTHRVSCSIHSR